MKEIINELQEEKRKIQSKIDFIENLDYTQPITEDDWNILCSTSLRNNTLLCMLVKVTFPEAEKIILEKDWVNFTLCGFECSIPTRKHSGIYIDFGWYTSCCIPKAPYTVEEIRMKHYFEEKDNEANWEKLFDLRIPTWEKAPKWKKYIAWHLIVKWRSDNREIWEEKFKETEKLYSQMKKDYEVQKKETHDKLMSIINILIPKLQNFSNNIKCKNTWDLTLEQIANKECIPLK